MKVRLKELGTIFTGNTPSKKVDEYWSNRNIKFIKPDVIKDELCVISSANEYISASAKNVSRIVPANSILVTCIGKIGRVGITEEEVSFNQQINAIVPNEAIRANYLRHTISATSNALYIEAVAPDSLSWSRNLATP
ncbi:restriction endonuclease subunit S [Candidatus Minimicrobia vallesae]|uniref:Restriction endonuclease subunit S n=1 Tax=Candidatus Minimicrobia vallesae TaxID=2841264 RepID=A0A8F1SAP4_9BACT|nr:restriction endonuclease subunit S [Candidatus Minimicrobia vallesae]QWQ31793.1 restriction endonuclease subunit S [Candidatus Minimicrobia vallesae]